MTAAVIVTWRGHIIGERYGTDITARTPLGELVHGQERDGGAHGDSHPAGRV